MIAPDSPPFAIRDATQADIEAIASIYAHHVRTGFGTFDEEPPQPAHMAERMVRIAELKLPYAVATVGREVVGYAYAAPYRPRSAYRFTVEDSIYVAPDVQRRGIGAVLLQEIVERCGEAGLRQMIAVIGDSANHASIKVHAKCGFRHVGVLADVGFKAGRWVDTVVMQRELRTANAERREHG